ncbi:MAG: thiol reductant ABC exporter subunit CydD [Proteobacteria bacterium]|nr:thiol reductant ABC exporter subunit CydD [Pseudomonadota bacterium]
MIVENSVITENSRKNNVRDASRLPDQSSAPRRRPDAGSVAQLLAAALWLPQAGLVAWAVQRLADGGGWQVVWVPAAGVLALGLLRAAGEAWGLRRLFGRARAELSALRAQVTVALASRSPIDRARPTSGAAASAIAEQAEAVLPWLVRYQPVRLRVTVMPVVIVSAVAWFSWAAALVLLVAAPLIPLFMAIVGWRAQAASEAQMVRQGQMNGFLLDRLRGLVTLRALDAVGATAIRLRDSAEGLRQRTMAVLRIAFLSSAVLELFSALGVAMVAVYIGFHLLGHLGFGTWGAPLTLGQGLFVLLLAPAFFEPLRELAAVWHDRAAGEAAIGALERLVGQGQPLPDAQADAAAPRPVRSTGAVTVAVRGLHFAHAGEAPVFEGVDLAVHSGEHVALMGASGSGKTTLLALLAGLATPDAGEIRLGDRVLDAGSAADLRARIGWMGQRPHVFTGSVTANVALGRPALSTVQVEEVMRFAALDTVAQVHPATPLGEGGAGLSGGEAVRLALARLAVHPDAGLMLADEPTAHLDAETAARVIDALLALARGRTLIVATHDPRVAARMHRVIALGADPLKEAA